jgi:hypothetical protein
MVTVIKQSVDWAELDLDRRFLEGLGYAVRLEADPARSLPGLVIGQQAYRLVALVAEQGKLIQEAFSQGRDLGPCPSGLIVPLPPGGSGADSEFFSHIKSVVVGLFKRHR